MSFVAPRLITDDLTKVAYRATNIVDSTCCSHPDDLRSLARFRSPTDLKSVVTPSSMKGRMVSDHNPNDRVYARVHKPLDEMTPEEIHEFAEETYEQIMKLMRGGE